MPRKGKERPFLCNSVRASERRSGVGVARTLTRAAADWNVITVGSRWPDHQDTAATPTYNYQNTLEHSTIGVRPPCAICDRPYFYLQKYSSSFSCKHSATKVQSYRTFHNGPAMLQQSTGEQIEQSEFNLLRRTSLNFFTYYKYLKRKFMVNCFSLFLAHAICWLETFESLQN